MPKPLKGQKRTHLIALGDAAPPHHVANAAMANAPPITYQGRAAKKFDGLLGRGNGLSSGCSALRHGATMSQIATKVKSHIATSSMGLREMVERHDDYGDTSMEAVAARLRWSREALGFSKKRDFHKDIRIDGKPLRHNTYSPFEQGSRLLTLDTAIALCKAYELSLDWLYFGKLGTIANPDLQRRIRNIRAQHITR